MKFKPNLTFSKLDPVSDEALCRMFSKKDVMVEINPGGVILPAEFKNIGQDILDMDVYESDVWMCSYPRTGSTWAQEMVWLIGHGLDYEGAKSLQQIRCPLVELSCIMIDGHAKWHDQSIKANSSVDLAKHHIPHPRYIRSHLSWELLPSDMQREDATVKPKVIYTTRNPKDLVVSYYHYFTLVHGLQGTFEEFCELFMRGRAPYGPFFNHALGFWNRRNDPNVLFIKYEDMKRDLPGIVRQTAAFLEKTITEDQVAKLCDHLSFKNMKTNRAVNLEVILESSYGKSYLEQTDLRFIRKGEVGDWKNYMSDDLSRRFDQWVIEHLEGTGLSFE